MTVISKQAIAGEMPFRQRFVRWRHRHRQALEGWLILTPILLYYSFFFIFPVVGNLYLSFTSWSGVAGAPKWVGLAQYKVNLSGDYLLTITANSPEVTKSVEFRVTVATPTIWGWVGFGIVGLVVIGLAIVFFRLGRR